MTTPRFPYRYNNTYGRWETPNGQFLTNDAVISEMRVHQQATQDNLTRYTEQLYSGSLTLPQWQVAVAQELKEAHLAQAMFAVGGKQNMTQANYGRVGGTLADEYRYLTNFAQEIANGNQSQAQALARIKQYGNNTQQAYWREWQEARPDGALLYWRTNPGDICRPSASGMGCLDIEAGNPYKKGELPTVPGAGATTCRGNCRCTVHEEPA